MKLFPYQNHVHWVFIGFPMVFPNDFAHVLWFFFVTKMMITTILWLLMILRSAQSPESPKNVEFQGMLLLLRLCQPDQARLISAEKQQWQKAIRLQVANDLPWFATSHQHQNISKYSKIGLKQSKTCFFYCCFMPFHHFFGGVLMFLDVSWCFWMFQGDAKSEPLKRLVPWMPPSGHAAANTSAQALERPKAMVSAGEHVKWFFTCDLWSKYI